MVRFFAAGWRRQDSCLAIALILFGLLVIDQANRLPPPFFDPLGSAAVPRLVAGLIILLAVILLGRCWWTPIVDDTSQTTGVIPAPFIALGAAVMPILYVGAMHFKILGFAPASALFVLALGSLLARFRVLAMLALLPVALLAGFGLNVLLTELFYIDLPQQSFWTKVP